MGKLTRRGQRQSAYERRCLEVLVKAPIIARGNGRFTAGEEGAGSHTHPQMEAQGRASLVAVRLTLDVTRSIPTTACPNSWA